MQFGTWAPYAGPAAIVVAMGLLVVAVVFAWLAVRLPLPMVPRRRRRRAKAFIVAMWLLALWTLSVGWQIAGLLVGHAFPGQEAPPSPVFPVTATAMFVAFVCIIALGERRGVRGGVVFGSAVAGAIAAPFVFEVPFDLIVMTRTFPDIPPDPTLFRVVYFAPLLFVGLSTITLLVLSPMVRLTATTLRVLAAMSVVFALWAAIFGFAYPGSPGPLAMNAISKILAFVATVTLFVPPAIPASASRDVDAPRPSSS